MASTVHLLCFCFLWLLPVTSSSATPGGGRRRAALGDFGALNEILRGAVLRLADTTLKSDGATLRLSAVRCRDLALGDLALSSRRAVASAVDVQLRVRALDMACTAEYDFSAWWLFGGGGSGTVDVASRGNDALVGGRLGSANLFQIAPESVAVLSCDPAVSIDEINFSNGGLLGWILNIFKGLLATFMESQARGVICDQLRQVMEDTEGLLRHAKQTLDDYKPNGLIWDPLTVEKPPWTFSKAGPVAKETNLVNFRSNTTKFAGWLESGVDQVVHYLTFPEEDPASETTDLRANALLRQKILDNDGALEIKDISAVTYEGHNQIATARVRIEGVKLVGLDSLRRFDPLDNIGKYTFQNKVSWDYLAFQIRATVELTPSTSSNSIIETPGDTKIKEQVEFFVGFKDLEAEMSIISLFDQELLQRIRLGSLLELDHILPCLLSTLAHAEFTSLSVEVADVLTPTLNGLVSPGIDRLFHSSMDASFLVYEHLARKAAPRFFQEKLRPVLSEILLKNNIGASTCVPAAWPGSASDLIDFRDLLLPPPIAQSAGATGLEPYGNAFSSYALPYLREHVFRGDLFNADYVRPFTESQSGAKGSLAFSNTLLQYNDVMPSPIYDSLMFTVSHLRLQNIDTVVGLMSLMHPVDWNTLKNKIAFGQSNTSGDKDLTMAVRMSLEIGGNASPLKMQNTFDLNLSIPSSALSFELLVNLRESVLGFSVLDLTNYPCWLANLDDRLFLSSLSLEIDSFRLDSACVSCSSPGIGLLPAFIRDLETAGFNSLFKDKIVDMLVGLIVDFTNDSFDMDGLIDRAPKHCPQHPSYDPTVEVDFLWPGLPALRSDSAETVIAIGLIALQIAMIGAAKNQLLLAEEDASHTSNSSRDNSDLGVVIPPQSALTYSNVPLEFPKGSRIVNWTTLNEDIGDWAGIAFEELRSYLKGTVTDPPELDTRSNLQVNGLLQTFVLDSDSAYTMHFNDLQFAALGVELELVAVKVNGLDSVKSLDPLVPTAPQMLKNRVEFEALSFAFHVEISSNSGESTPLTITYELQDIIVLIDMDVAVDLGKLEVIQLGSLFDMGRILACAAGGIKDLKLSTLHLQSESIGDPVINGNGYFSDDNEEGMQHIARTLFGNYRADLIDAMPLLFDSLPREIVNAMIPKILESTSHQCLPPTNYSSTGIVDYRDLLLSESLSSSFGGNGTSPYGNLFRNIYNIISGPSNGVLTNDILRGVTNHLSNVTGSMLKLEKNGRIEIEGLNASFGVVISEIAVENIDSVGDPLAIFHPVLGEAHILNNTVSFGVDSKPLQVTGKLLLSFSDDDDIQMRNEVTFSVSFENLVLVASVLIQLSERDLSLFPLRDLTNIHCWLSAIHRTPRLRGIDLIDHYFSVQNFSLGFNCISCSSPRFDELLLSLYSNTSEAINSIQEKTDDLLDAGFIQVFLDHIVDDSSRLCPHRPEFNPNTLEEEFLLSTAEASGLWEESVNKPVYFTVINSGIAGLIFIFGILCRGMVNRRNRQWIESLTREDHLLLESQQEKEKEMIKMLNETTTSLFKSEYISKRVRYGVPIVLALNLGFLLGARLAVTYVVNVEASVAGEDFTINSFLEYRFFESTKKTFQNGGAEMVILIWVFAGVWPYIKVALSLVMWMAPPEWVSVVNRGRVFLWIDAAAKLGVVDIFTVIVGVALLLVFIGGPDESYSDEDMLYSLKAIVVPRAGFYCIIIAHRISRVTSRFFLEYHEQTTKNAALHYEYTTTDPVSAQKERHSLHPPAPPSDNGSDESDTVEQLRQPQRSVWDEECSRNNDTTKVQHSYDEAIDHLVSSISMNDDVYTKTTETPQKEARWGTVGAYLSATTIIIVLIIGAIFSPSISLDASSVAALAIESDQTYEEMAQNWGVFQVVSGVLLKARFVFDGEANYSFFGLLLFSGLLFSGLVFIMKVYQFIKQTGVIRCKERTPTPVTTPPAVDKDRRIPLYARLTKWRHMEIYLISVAVGIWQLGAIFSFSVYTYCKILNRMFLFMTLIGLVKETPAEVECYNIQASLPENLGIIMGSVGVLLASFFAQASNQYKKNISETFQWTGNDDDERNRDKSTKVKYSHIISFCTASASLSRDSIKNLMGKVPVKREKTPSMSSSFKDSGFDAPIS